METRKYIYAGGLVRQLFTLLFTMLLSWSVWAQASFRVTSFYEAEAYLTERLIPFAVRYRSGESVEALLLVEVSKPCQAMVDPHRPYVFHLYCTEEADVASVVTIKEGAKQYRLTVPSVQVRKLAIISSTPNPAATGSAKGGR